MSSSSKRACDACHRRKVRCDGTHPCRNCVQSTLSCTFNKLPQKKGPKGSRAKVISELRESQRHKPPGPLNSTGADSHLPSSLSQRTPELLSPELIDRCTSLYFTYVYPTMPMLHVTQVQKNRAEIETSTEAYCFIGAVCAFVVIQPGLQLREYLDEPNLTSSGRDLKQGSLLVEEIVRVRNGYDHVDNPTFYTVTTTFLLAASYFGLERHNSAWFYLREAITLANILGMQDESTYIDGDTDSAMKRHLFWLLHISERAYALHKHWPLTMHATIRPPQCEGANDVATVEGLSHLVELFSIIDDDFSRLWNKARSDCNPAWLLSLQHRLTLALPAATQCTEIQEADLRVTQQWLRTVVWQLSTASGCLSSQSADESMTLTYPIEIVRDLLAITDRLSKQALEVHGIGLIEKLFDIACTLADVMSCVPIDESSLDVGPHDCLMRLTHLISTLRGGATRYVGLLQAKINETLPNTASSFVFPLQASLPPEWALSEDSSESAASTPYASPLLPFAATSILFPMSSSGLVPALTSPLHALTAPTSYPSVPIAIYPPYKE